MHTSSCFLPWLVDIEESQLKPIDQPLAKMTERLSAYDMTTDAALNFLLP